MTDQPLLIIIPSRGRPGAVADLLTSWRATADGVAEPCIVTDDDDPAAPEYERVLAHQGVKHLTGPRLRLAGSLNAAAMTYWDRYPMLGFWGDDMRPRTQHWDTHFVRTLTHLKTGVVYGNDLLMGPLMPTAVTMTSDIPRTLGYMAIPGPVHLCLDLGWMDWGNGIGRLRYLRNVIIEHLHPAAGKAGWDGTYEDCNSVERNAHDHPAYERYRDEILQSDLVKLRKLIRR